MVLIDGSVTKRSSVHDLYEKEGMKYQSNCAANTLN